MKPMWWPLRRNEMKTDETKEGEERCPRPAGRWAESPLEDRSPRSFLEVRDDGEAVQELKRAIRRTAGSGSPPGAMRPYGYPGYVCHRFEADNGDLEGTCEKHPDDPMMLRSRPSRSPARAFTARITRRRPERRAGNRRCRSSRGRCTGSTTGRSSGLDTSGAWLHRWAGSTQWTVGEDRLVEVGQRSARRPRPER